MLVCDSNLSIKTNNQNTIWIGKTYWKILVQDFTFFSLSLVDYMI
jgi:hypothetical protein